METSSKGPVRVVVIDDSPTERLFMVSLFAGTEGMQVVGTGTNGIDAINLSKTLRPDIIVMDVIMPQVNGLEATAHIMHEHPTPIVLMTSTQNSAEMNLSFEAQRAGALFAVVKPVLTDFEACESFIRTVRAMAQVPLVRRWSKPQKRIPATTGSLIPLDKSSERLALMKEQMKHLHVIGIASSTGGPSVLINVLQSLTGQFPVPVLVVQHVSRGFAAGLAEWLDSELTMKVELAVENTKPEPGRVYIAPDDFHMELSAEGTIHLHQGPAFRGLRPSANYLFESLSKYYGKQALGIILTGMGDDGALGMLHLFQSGGLTIAQDRQSCVVYGMPKEAISAGAIDVVLTPAQINQTLQQFADTRGRPYEGKPTHSSPQGGSDVTVE